MKLFRGLPMLMAVGALAVAGCGSSDDEEPATSAAGESTESAPAEPAGGEFADVKAAIEKLQERPTEIPLTEPLEGEVPKGKTIDYLQCGVPACVVLGEYLKEATDAVGWKLKVIDAGGTPESVKAAWQQTIRNKPDGIVTTGGFPHDIFAGELKQAKKAGIPVIGHSEAVPAGEDGFVAMASGPERNDKIGVQEAEYIVAKSDGKAKVFFINSGYPINTEQFEAMERTLKEKCPSDCSVKKYDAPVTSIGKDLAGKVASQLQANPDVDYLVPAFGDMEIGVPAAVAGAGIELPPMITQEPGKANMADIRKGDLVSLIGSGPESMWGVVDTFIRDFNGEDYPKEIKLPEWLITKDNAPSEDQFPAVVDYQEQFKTLWGIG